MTKLSDLIARAAFGSRPAAGVNGRIFLPTDGYSIDRDNLSVYNPYGPIFPLTDPTLQTFAWINQGGAAVTESKNAVYLVGPGATSADNLRIRKKAKTGAYTIIACVLANIFNKAALQGGILWRQASDGKLVTVGIKGDGTVTVDKWTNETTFSANYLSYAHPARPLWLKIVDDNATNRTVSVSADGQNFILIHTVGRTDFLTATEVGVFVNANNSATPNLDAAITLLSWAES